jgi:branched-chain amino acid transport system permease protein
MKSKLLFAITHLLQRPWMEIIRTYHRKKTMPGSYLTVKGKRIYYVQEGEGDPILMIHGNTASHVWYQDVMHIPGFRTIAPDMVNFGHSDSIEKADIHLYADYLKAFMDKLSLKQCYLVGHSLGGAVALSLAFRYPEMVSRLLLIDPCPVEGLVTPEAYYPIIELYKTNRSLLKKALAAVVPTLQDGKRLNLLVNEAMLMDKAAYTGNARALERVDFRSEAAGFNKPVLVLVGGKDLLITEEMARKTGEALHGSTRLIEHVGHSLMLEDPALFKEIVVDFAGS